MDIEDFIKLQNEDQFCTATKNQIHTPNLGKLFKIKQGVLLLISGEQMTEDDTISQVPQIVVPQALTDMLIDIYHAGPNGAHLGARRVYLTLRRKYSFKDMQDKINTSIKQCMPCQLNMYTTRPAHKLHVKTLTSTPREAWAIDLCPDMPPSKGYNHIMIIMDLATNYVHLRPIKTKTSKELLTHTNQIIGMLGPPQVLRHDNEKGFTGGEFKDYCEHMKITQITGLANQGQTNEQIESQVRNMKHALCTLTTSQDSKANWPNELWSSTADVV